MISSAFPTAELRCQRGREHQLQQVVGQHRQQKQTGDGGREQHARERGAERDALLRPGEEEGDAVGRAQRQRAPEKAT